MTIRASVRVRGIQLKAHKHGIQDRKGLITVYTHVVQETYMYMYSLQFCNFDKEFQSLRLSWVRGRQPVLLGILPIG